MSKEGNHEHTVKDQMDDIVKKYSNYPMSDWEKKAKEQQLTPVPPEYAKKVFEDKADKEMSYEEARIAFWKHAKTRIPTYTIPNSPPYQKAIRTLTESTKGLLIIGGVGTGKTEFMKIMAQVMHYGGKGYMTQNCAVIEQEIRTNEKADYGWYDKKPMCLDDLGSEPAESVIFGNRIQPIGEIITRRYEKYQSTGLITHFTTNLPGIEAIEKRYGTRISDRILHMTEIVVFNWGSHRH